ncbi:MAG: CHAT domain-containing protein [Nitrospira sp.]
MASDGRKVCAPPRTLTPDDWKTLDVNNWSVLGARGARQARAAVPDEPGQSDEDQRPQWDGLLERLSKILLPTEVIAGLKSSNSDTLVVVPITVIQPEFSVEGPLTEQTINIPPIRRTLSLSTVPFAAFPFENGKLIDRFSIVMSPGFTSFTKNPKEVNKQFKDPIVIGNPANRAYPNLQGAEDEAKHVADRLGAKVFVRKSATKKVLKTYLRRHSASVDLIHLATHGVADAENPLDKSFLVFTDASWTARDIGTFRLTRKPLVVMSACQTALGKNFPSGTIGLAQAWHRAGASNVVMSLWSVDDTATKVLMEQFVDLVVSGKPVDKALQAAMVSLRQKYTNPSNWASFSIYGAPERIDGLSSTP